MSGIEKLLYDNRATVEPLAWLALSALVVTMPEPGAKLSPRTLYAWLYDFLHQFSNMKRPTGPAVAPESKQSQGTSS